MISGASVAIQARSRYVMPPKRSISPTTLCLTRVGAVEAGTEESTGAGREAGSSGERGIAQDVAVPRSPAQHRFIPQTTFSTTLSPGLCPISRTRSTRRPSLARLRKSFGRQFVLTYPQYSTESVRPSGVPGKTRGCVSRKDRLPPGCSAGSCHCEIRDSHLGK